MVQLFRTVQFLPEFVLCCLLESLLIRESFKKNRGTVDILPKFVLQFAYYSIQVCCATVSLTFYILQQWVYFTVGLK